MPMFLNFFLIPLIATLVFIAALYPYALKIGFTDKPCHRKQHKNPTPLIGGLAIYLSILVTLLSNNNPLANQSAFISAITLLVFVGLIDDYKGLGVKIRMVAQIAAGLIMAEYADIKINSLGNLLGFGGISLGIYATTFTVFAVVGGINAFNMIDGIDGLAGSLTLISISSLAMVAWMGNDSVLFSYCLVFVACILAFLSMNLRIFGRTSAKIFLGDTGSTLFGFTVCWLAIDASQGENELITPSTVLWIMALPLFDSVCIMLRRIRKGRSPFNPDREHLHHIFNIAGYSNNFTLILILISSIALSVIGLIASRYLGVQEPVLFWSFIGIFASHYWLMTHSWKIMKISRYLRVTKVLDRRVENQRKSEDRRSGVERRYIPSGHDLEEFYRSSGGLMSDLLGQRLQKNGAIDRRSVRNIFKSRKKVSVNKRFVDDRRRIITGQSPVSHSKEK